MPFSAFDALLTSTEREQIHRLNTAAKIQEFLDATPYSTDAGNRCPLQVLRDHRAHCLDGALFAAMCLWRLGYPPLILDILPEPGTDDDHLLSIYQIDGRYGAVAKSNFTGLRLREPVYCGLRELVMSYFENFFNVNGARTMRSYARPLKLAAYQRVNWMTTESGADFIEKKLYQLKTIPLLTDAMAKRLTPVDPQSYRAGTLATDPNGLYKPKK